MPSRSSRLLLVATLILGLLLGLNLARSRVSDRPVLATALPTPPPSQPDDGAALEAIARTEATLYQQIDRQYALFEPVNRAFELVARAVSPSVVHVVAHKVGPKPDGDRRTREFEETGSGVIVRGDGGKSLFVLTNNHVVANANADEIQIRLNDGRALRPATIWTDTRADIAVMKLDRDDLPAARLGDSDRVDVGTWVLAIGSPFGLTHSVSQGIISGRGRHEPDLEKAGVENQDFLQTDAAINPGNSGGPLVNLKGEVIGLNIAILSNGGGNEGVGFSIPINLARWIMRGLIAEGRVSRGALGVKLQPEYLPENALKLGLDRPRGAWVDSVDKASPAALGGVRVGDVILKFNGVEVIDLNHLINLVSMAPIGATANVIIWRDRKEWLVRITVGDRDRAVATSAPSPPSRGMPGAGAGSGTTLRRPSRPEATGTYGILGLELITLDADDAPRLGLPGNLLGAVVTKVEPGSPLTEYCLPLDVIHTVGSWSTRSAEEAARALAGRSEGDHLELGIHRMVDGTIRSIKVRLP